MFYGEVMLNNTQNVHHLNISKFNIFLKSFEEHGGKLKNDSIMNFAGTFILMLGCEHFWVTAGLSVLMLTPLVFLTSI